MWLIRVLPDEGDGKRWLKDDPAREELGKRVFGLDPGPSVYLVGGAFQEARVCAAHFTTLMRGTTKPIWALRIPVLEPGTELSLGGNKWVPILNHRGTTGVPCADEAHRELDIRRDWLPDLVDLLQREICVGEDMIRIIGTSCLNSLLKELADMADADPKAKTLARKALGMGT